MVRLGLDFVLDTRILTALADDHYEFPASRVSSGKDKSLSSMECAWCLDLAILELEDASTAASACWLNCLRWENIVQQDIDRFCTVSCSSGRRVRTELLSNRH